MLDKRIRCASFVCQVFGDWAMLNDFFKLPITTNKVDVASIARFDLTTSRTWASQLLSISGRCTNTSDLIVHNPAGVTTHITSLRADAGGACCLFGNLCVPTCGQVPCCCVETSMATRPSRTHKNSIDSLRVQGRTVSLLCLTLDVPLATFKHNFRQAMS